MSEESIRLPPDGTGKRMRAIMENINGTDVYEEVHRTLNRTLGDIPANHTVTKVTVQEDASGNVKSLIVYDGSTVLFQIVISKAGVAVSSYDIFRL